MRTQSQTIVMYGFLISCVMSIVSLFLPAYSLNFGSTGFLEATSDTYRIISNYYSWPVLLLAAGGIIMILMMYRRKYVLISGGVQAIGLFYQVYKLATLQDNLKDSKTIVGSLSDIWAAIGGNSGISVTLEIGFYMAIISACAVALFSLFCYFMVEDTY